MPSIHIVSDSSARFIDPKTASHPLVTLAPVTLHWNADSMVDHPAVSLDSARSLFKRHPGLPTAQAASRAQLEAIYSTLQEDTDQIVSIHTSSALGAGYRNAVQASERFRGRCDLQVLDSHTASAGLGLLVSAAVEAVERGAEMEDLVRVIRGMISRMYMVLYLDELPYLERAGLISRSQAILGDMLGIIPFLTMENGQLVPMEKVRTRPRALEKLVEFVAEFTDIERLAILHRGARPGEEAQTAAERLSALYAQTPIHFVDYGPSLATHVGLNGLGVVVLESAQEAL